MTKEEIKQKRHEYYLKHREEIKENVKKWNESNQERKTKYKRNWYQDNKKKIHEERMKYQREWRKTPIGRATSLLSAYRQADKNMGRGECNLTAQWIVDNIFSKSCPYCGETDWNKLGCNRLDNSKPHTTDNVEACCGKCNQLMQKQIRDKDNGKFIRK